MNSEALNQREEWRGTKRETCIILFCHVQTKGFKFHLNPKISDVELKEEVLIMRNLCVRVFVSSSVSACEEMYLALATHSMMASFLPMVTLVFLGGMMMEGAMGSAGPPTSVTHTQRDTKEVDRKKKVKEIICRAQIKPVHPSV